MDDFEPFHSAVNRIPVLRNIATRAAALGNLSPELFGEKQFIPGHDRLCADRDRKSTRLNSSHGS